MQSYQNPIISGFFPDPSCVRVGDTYYLVNSSFQFFPGIPIHASKDLINWSLIGNALCRVSQISLDKAVTKTNNAANKEIFTAGIYAPTLRYHQGLFYIICTNLIGHDPVPPDVDFVPSNFFVTSTDLSDPSTFSDPIFFDFAGIDPSLFFDDDGRAFVQGSWIYGYRSSPATTIKQFEIDLATGKAISPIREIWNGASGIIPEGPHMYKKGGDYFLLVAEGGTHRGHRVCMARSHSPWGPFESCPSNPLVIGSEASGIIQCIGHADLFQDDHDRWWAVMLARREYEESYPLGRETFLVPVIWKDGEWPQFETPRLVQPCDRVLAPRKSLKWEERVTLTGPKTRFLRTPRLEDYWEKGTSLFVQSSSTPLTAREGTVSFVGQIQESHRSAVAVTLFPRRVCGAECCGLTVYKDPWRHGSIEWNSEQNQLSLRLQKTESEEPIAVFETTLRNCAELTIQIRASVDTYRFYYVLGPPDDIEAQGSLMGEFETKHLSGNDFTGPVLGVYATGPGSIVEFSNFTLEHDVRE